MGKFIPRKIKKACKAYGNDAPIKTKWLRYVYARHAIDWYCMENADKFESKEYLL